jgi:ubiquinone/menaquinone biosynthesis C-methylase UbiE
MNIKNILSFFSTVLLLGGSSQCFIGARWIVTILRVTPKKYKRSMALFFISRSPHYFYRVINDEYSNLSLISFLEKEFTRNKDSREKIKDILLTQYLKPNQTVIDYGCGPGFMAHEVSSSVGKVIAIDISIGVLECARIINNQANIEQMNSIEDKSVDFIYSFAVI